jgi:hypothetical protein
MKHFSTREVAERVGVHPITLEKWLAQDRIPQPQRLEVGGRVVRLWTAADVREVRKFKAGNYRKGRGRKPKSKPAKGGAR